ncbi:MAG: proton-conducting transporter membrane subunit [Dehalococcoidales bacterium]|nr:proton-conducting transporter membrane subunit [Dehalococcoidales bacterium]
MQVAPLAILWFLAVILAFLDGRRAYAGWLGVAGLAASLGILLWLAGQIAAVGPLVMTAGDWPAGVGIVLRLDMLGVVFAILSTAVLLTALAYEVLRGVLLPPFPALVLFLAAGLNGLFATGDAFNFYVFFEVSMTASFVLTSYGEHRRQTRVTVVFVVVNLLGSVLFLVAVAALYHVTGTLAMAQIASRIVSVTPTTVLLIGTLIFAAFGIKLGLFPFHYWLPPVYRDATPVVAAILAGALANIGAYGLLRFGGELLPSALQAGAWALVVIGGVSIVYGEVIAISRCPTSEVLAYSSISQAGYILIAIAIGGPVGYAAAVLYTVANSFNKTMLFLASGVRGWLVGAAFAIGGFSVAGIPPSVGFFGKVALFRTGFAGDNAAVLALVFVGGALSLIYMFQVYQRRYWAADQPERPSPVGARITVIALASLIVALGLWPEPLLAATTQAAAVLGGGAR